jgi:hypothetical protein
MPVLLANEWDAGRIAVLTSVGFLLGRALGLITAVVHGRIMARRPTHPERAGRSDRRI